jgi:hypothetical protein
MVARITMRVPVPDLAAAFQDDPAQLVELLAALAAADFVQGGTLTAEMEAHAPVLIEPLQVFIGRLAGAFGVAVAA